jgi:hypothetical protein
MATNKASDELNKKFEGIDLCRPEHQARSNVRKIINSIGNVLFVYPTYESQKHVIQKVFSCPMVVNLVLVGFKSQAHLVIVQEESSRD